MSADYFILPSACTNAPSCPIIQHDEDDGSNNDVDDAIPSSTSCSDKAQVELEAALVVIPIVVFFLGLGAGFLGGKYIYESKSSSTVTNTVSDYNAGMNSAGIGSGSSSGGSNSIRGKNRNRMKDEDSESTNPMNPSSSIELLTKGGRSSVEVL